MERRGRERRGFSLGRGGTRLARVFRGRVDSQSVSRLREMNASLPFEGRPTQEGVPNRVLPFWRDSYLVDPASSHMLVSKIKPCMSKYEH